MGLATDYCVQYSVLDARQWRYTPFVIIDGCYGVDKTPGDIEKAIQTMQQAGTSIVTNEWIKMRAHPPLS